MNWQDVRASRGRQVAAVAVALGLTACGGARGRAGSGPRDGTGSGSAVATPRALTVGADELARLEQARGASVPRLIALLRDGDAAAKAGAVRALGRIGTRAAAVALIEVATASSDLALAALAAAALGVAAATAAPTTAMGPRPDELDLAALSAAMLQTAARPDIDRVAVAVALGQAGDAAVLPILSAWAGAVEPDLAAAAGRALGRLGRRKVELDGAARAALIVRTGDGNRDVRYAALYGLAREHRATDAPVDAGSVSALMGHMVDADPEIRMLVIGGLARRGPLGDGEPLFVGALDDADPRVAVEAARAIATKGSATSYAALGTRLQRWARELPTRGTTPGVHALIEGLRAVLPIARDTALATSIEAVRDELAGQLARTATAQLAQGWGHCLAQAALERARLRSFDGGHRMMACGGGKLAAGDVSALLAEVSLGIRDDGDPRRALASEIATSMMGSRDPRVHVAGLAMIAPVWATLLADAKALLGESLAVSLASPATFEAAAAAEALGKILAAVPVGKAPDAELAGAIAALISGAATTQDPELWTSLVAALGEGRIADGEPACRTAASSGWPAVASAGRTCLGVLGGASADAAPVQVLAAPPAQPATVIGKQVTWTVELSTGTVVIDLDAALAPWNVAALVALTQRGYFDGLLVHRVVPGFVLQTGDPTGTGWGGPGYAVASEPASGADARGFTTGAVGIADAGKDTGGSQWFVMTGPAPHLDGSYTQVGRVRSGQPAVDRAIIGDRIVRATVDVR